MDIVINKLNKDYLVQHVDEFIRITSFDQNEYWKQENFTRELPGKYDLSLYAVQNNSLIGFIIASKKEEGSYIHKFMVHPDFRSKKIGSELLSKFQELTSSAISLNVSTSNKRGILFYENNGFTIKGTKTDSILKSELYIMQKTK